MNKSSNKNTWIWLIVGGSILCITNIVLSCIFRGTDGANIFTAISGWVSGVSTIILGVIAVVQNKQYKDENDRVLLKQSEENSKFSESQKDISWRNAQFQLFTLYLNTLNKHIGAFSQYNFGKIHNDILALEVNSENYVTIICEKNVLISELTSLKNFLLSSRYCCFEKEDMFNTCSEYLDKTIHYFEENFFGKYKWYVNTFKHSKLEENKDAYQILKEKSQQLYDLGRECKAKLLEHIYKLNDFVAGLFYMSSEELKTMLENSNNEYKSWLEKVRKQQEQNNGKDTDDEQGKDDDGQGNDEDNAA